MKRDKKRANEISANAGLPLQIANLQSEVHLSSMLRLIGKAARAAAAAKTHTRRKNAKSNDLERQPGRRPPFAPGSSDTSHMHHAAHVSHLRAFSTSDSRSMWPPRLADRGGHQAGGRLLASCVSRAEPIMRCAGMSSGVTKRGYSARAFDAPPGAENAVHAKSRLPQGGSCRFRSVAINGGA